MFKTAPGGANMASTFLRLPDVKARTGLSRSTIYLRVSEGKFPSPVALGGRAVGWVEAELDNWIEDQIATSRQAVKEGEKQ
jgi:prophage regulatory protein